MAPEALSMEEPGREDPGRYGGCSARPPGVAVLDLGAAVGEEPEAEGVGQKRQPAGAATDTHARAQTYAHIYAQSAFLSNLYGGTRYSC